MVGERAVGGYVIRVHHGVRAEHLRLRRADRRARAGPPLVDRVRCGLRPQTPLSDVSV